MALIRIDHHPPPRQLRLFGLLWLLFFGALGAVIGHKTGSWPAAGAIWLAAALIPALGWLHLPFLRLAYVGMAYAALPIGWVISHLLLALIYYCLLTPLGLGLRLFGHDPLAMRRRPAGSGWRPRPARHGVERYFRQY